MKARLYRFENGFWGVQKRRFLFFWCLLTEVDPISNDWGFTIRRYVQWGDRRMAEKVRDNINAAGPVK